MVALDTNVVLRVLVMDDPNQCRRAEQAWAHAIAADGIFIAKTVVVELGWVLRVACKLPRTTIAAHLRGLLDADHVTIKNSDLVARALAAYEAGTADLSDYVILESARGASALPVLTFDERFARSSDVAAVPALAPE